MGKLFIAIFFLTGLGINAQTIVFDKQLGDSIKVIKYQYLEKTNKLALGYENKNDDGKYSIYTIDSQGNKEIILKDKFDGFTFSPIEDAVCLYETIRGTPYKFKYYSIKNKLTTDYFKRSVNHEFFTKDYKLDLNNSSGNYKINLYKDDAYFIKKSFSNGSEKSIKIPKPDFETFANPSNPKASDLAFQKRLIDENTFEIVSKRTNLSNNINTSTLYRTQYDFNGKIINKYKYTYTIPKGLYLWAGSKAKNENSMYSFGSELNFYNSLDVNNYLIDNDTKDVFIYGIVIDKESHQPIAFYITRFKNSGELMWNKFNEVDDKEGFNKDKKSTNLSIDMNEFMDNNTLALSIEGGYKDKYNNFFLIDKQTGNIVEKKSKTIDLEAYKGTLTSDKNHSIFNALKLNKNKYASTNVILAMSFNKKIEDLINQKASKSEVFYDAILSKKGIWILESDNKTYFKVTLFNE